MSRAFTKEQDDVPEPELVLRPRRKDADTPVAPADRETAGYSATVAVEGIGDAPRTFTIVDADQTDLSAGRIGIDSPLATALLGARAGEDVVWHRPAGDLTLHVVSIEYR